MVAKKENSSCGSLKPNSEAFFFLILPINGYCVDALSVEQIVETMSTARH